MIDNLGFFFFINQKFWYLTPKMKKQTNGVIKSQVISLFEFCAYLVILNEDQLSWNG